MLMLAEQEKEGLRKEIAQRDESLADSLSEEERLAEELELMQSEPHHLEQLWINTRKYRAMLINYPEQALRDGLVARTAAAE